MSNGIVDVPMESFPLSVEVAMPVSLLRVGEKFPVAVKGGYE